MCCKSCLSTPILNRKHEVINTNTLEEMRWAHKWILHLLYMHYTCTTGTNLTFCPVVTLMTRLSSGIKLLNIWYGDVLSYLKEVHLKTGNKIRSMCSLNLLCISKKVDLDLGHRAVASSILISTISIDHV